MSKYRKKGHPGYHQRVEGQSREETNCEKSEEGTKKVYMARIREEEANDSSKEGKINAFSKKFA